MSIVEQQDKAIVGTLPFRIDVHHHVYPSSFLSEQGKLNPAWHPQKPPEMVKDWTPQTAIDEMDANGIAVSIVSTDGAVSRDGPRQ